MAVEPYRGPMVDTIERDVNPFLVSHRRRQFEIFHIYALTASEISRRTAHLRVERQETAPVVRHADALEPASTRISLHSGSRHLCCRHLCLFRLSVVGHLRLCSFFPLSAETDVFHS